MKDVIAKLLLVVSDHNSTGVELTRQEVKGFVELFGRDVLKAKQNEMVTWRKWLAKFDA